jgi:hypothetical protein
MACKMNEVTAVTTDRERTSQVDDTTESRDYHECSGEVSVQQVCVNYYFKYPFIVISASLNL